MNDRQKQNNKTVNICGIHSSLEEAFEFCWSSFADKHNNITVFTKIDQEKLCKLNKFACGTPWLLDLLCKHWFTSSVWNFCCWVADFPPRETSPPARKKKKPLFSQAMSATSFPTLWFVPTFHFPFSHAQFQLPLSHLQCDRENCKHLKIYLECLLFLNQSSLRTSCAKTVDWINNH